MNLSVQEIEILTLLRGLVPHEEIRIVKDQNGRPDHYFVVRTQKIVISKREMADISLLDIK